MSQTTTAAAGTKPAAPHEPGEAPGMSHREVLTALSGLLMGMLVAILSSTVVSTSLPRIVSDLNGSQTAMARTEQVAVTEIIAPGGQTLAQAALVGPREGQLDRAVRHDSQGAGPGARLVDDLAGLVPALGEAVGELCQLGIAQPAE